MLGNIQNECNDLGVESSVGIFKIDLHTNTPETWYTYSNTIDNVHNCPKCCE